jgi:hypothetical protein
VPALGAQQVPDSALLAAIRSIRAVDDHAHPQPISTENEADEFDPPPFVPSLGPPALLRADNPAWPRAWQMLYGYSSRIDSLTVIKRNAKAARGSAYPGWVLDKLGIETMLANRHSLGAGLIAPRFRLVWFADPLVFPLNNESAKAANPAKREELESMEKWLDFYLKGAKLPRKPATLDAYVSQLIIPALEQKKKEGAVAIKFAIAYVRDLGVGNPSQSDAAAVYAKYIAGGNPADADYRTLQDYLIRRIAREAGRLGLPVQIHVGAGSGPYFDNAGADPFLLMPMLLDSSLRKTTFVLVHGGFPSAQATRVIFAKPNVYVDFSSQGFLSSTRELSQVLRSWLEFRPEKVMFGTDAYPISASIGWEEVGWMTNESSRRALAIALTGMMSDGEIDRARALQIARMVMRETALSVYSLDK